MVSKAEIYQHLLQELEKSTGDILSAAIVTPDGLIMSNTSSAGIDKDTFAAYSAATFRRAGHAMEELSKENIETLLFESKNYRVMTIRVSDYALLIALAGKNADTDSVLSGMQETARRIREV